MGKSDKIWDTNVSCYTQDETQDSCTDMGVWGGFQYDSSQMPPTKC